MDFQAVTYHVIVCPIVADVRVTDGQERRLVDHRQPDRAEKKTSQSKLELVGNLSTALAYRLVLLCAVTLAPRCSNAASRDFCSSLRQALDLLSWTRMSHMSCICLCWEQI